MMTIDKKIEKFNKSSSQFKLTKMEINRVNQFARRRDSKDSQITGYSCTAMADETGFSLFVVKSAPKTEPIERMTLSSTSAYGTDAALSLVQL